MMTGPSPLFQYNVKQSNEKKKSDDRGSQFRRMIPTLLINVVVPLKNGKLVEHWDLAQEEVPAAQTKSC